MIKTKPPAKTTKTKPANKPRKSPVRAASERFDWEGLLALSRRAYGHTERRAPTPSNAALTEARRELKTSLIQIAERYCARVRAYTGKPAGDSYLLVEGELAPKRSLNFRVGGEGYAWVDIVDDRMVVFDCMGFDDMSWSTVEETINWAKREPQRDTRKPSRNRAPPPKSEPPKPIGRGNPYQLVAEHESVLGYEAMARTPSGNRVLLATRDTLGMFDSQSGAYAQGTCTALRGARPVQLASGEDDAAIMWADQPNKGIGFEPCMAMLWHLRSKQWVARPLRDIHTIFTLNAYPHGFAIHGTWTTNGRTKYQTAGYEWSGKLVKRIAVFEAIPCGRRRFVTITLPHVLDGHVSVQGSSGGDEWDLHGIKDLDGLDGQGSPILHPDGDRVIVILKPPIRSMVISLNKRAVVHRFVAPASGLVFSPTGDRAVFFEKSTKAQLWDGNLSRAILTFEPSAVAFSPKGERFATVSHSNGSVRSTVRVRSASDGRQVAAWTGDPSNGEHNEPQSHVAIGSDWVAATFGPRAFLWRQPAG
jgi:hypothetical protein